MKRLAFLALSILACIGVLWSATGSQLTFTLGTTPGNPAAGKVRLWANTASGNLECLTSAGASCIGGGAPAGVTFTLCASAGCVLNETSNWESFLTSSGTLSKCGVAAVVAPTGSSIIVDLLKNGTSVFGGNPKPTVATSSTSYSSVTTFNTASVAEGDLLIGKVTQADSNGVGQFVTLKCSF